MTQGVQHSLEMGIRASRQERTSIPRESTARVDKTITALRRRETWNCRAKG